MKFQRILPFFLVLFLLLIAYHLTLLFFPFSPDQQSTLLFLVGGTPLTLPFTQAELAHLDDVHRVMRAASFLFLIIFIGGIMKFLRMRKRSNDLLIIFPALKKSLLLLVLLLPAVVLFFPFLFTLFHWVLFPQGNWQFPADSLLIKTFPGDFFVAISVTIFSGAALLGAVALLAAWLLIRKRDSSARISRKP